MLRAKCRAPFTWFGGNHKTTHRTACLFNKHSRNHLQIPKHSKIYPDLLSAVRQVACTKASENLVAMTTLMLMKWQTARRGRCRLLSDVWSQLLLVLTPFINTLSVTGICVTNKLNSGSRLRGCNLLHQDTEICSSTITKMNSKIQSCSVYISIYT